MVTTCVLGGHLVFSNIKVTKLSKMFNFSQVEVAFRPSWADGRKVL